MNKIKLTFILSIACFLLSNPITSYAKQEVEYGYFNINGVSTRLPIADLEIDGYSINKSTVGVDPIIINSRTLVPLRALSEKLNYHVTWIEKLQKVSIEKSNNKIELFLGSPNAKVNNKDVTVTDNVSPIAIEGRTYVPIRFVVENMGLNIDYNPKLNKISLNSTDIDNFIFESTSKENSNKKEDLDIFAVGKDSVKEPAKPQAPVKTVEPTIPTVPSPVNPNKTQKEQEQSKTQTEKINENKNARYNLESYFIKSDTETFNIKQDLGYMDTNYFFLSSPKRLVIDIKDAKLKSDENVKFDSIDLLSVNSLYHSEGNYTRFVIMLNENLKNEDIKVQKENNILKVEKVKNIEPVKQGDEFKYNFDRKTGAVELKLSKDVDIYNSSIDVAILEIKVPKDAIKLKEGNLNISNRLISKLEISKNDTDYIIKIHLMERVSYAINKTSPTSARITFNKNDRQVPLIVLDPGHGGKDAGAINKEFNINEKTLNIQVAAKLRAKLENAGYIVEMTRTDDTFVPLNDIAGFSNSKDPDIFISIHHNSASEGSQAKGIESFYHISGDSRKLAEIIQKQLISYTSANNRGVKSMPFVVIKKTSSPAVLLELGFMTNKEEVQKNMSDSYQEQLSDAIKSAVDIYFGR